MSYHHVPTIAFLVGPDKVSATTRYDRGIGITTQAPQSPLYQQHPDLKAAADEVMKDTVSLKSLLDANTSAEAAAKVTRTALGNGIIAWDTSYAVFVTLGEKYAVTPNDAHALGAVARGKNIHPLAMPLGVDAKFDAKRNQFRLHVHRAPGMKVVAVELSPDPVTATSWVELPGTGAIRLVPNPAKGTWWVRACSKTAKGNSDFTTPVSVIVK